jgi:hypothetical protein
MIAGYAITAPDGAIDAVLAADRSVAEAAYASIKARSKWPESVVMWDAWLFNYGERGAWWEPRSDGSQGEEK